MGRFWVFFLSHTAPGFQLWFYFHLCMWVIHWSLLLGLPWRTWVCPIEGQVWRWCSCLGGRGPSSTRYSGELAGLGQQEICSRRVWQPVLANTLQYSHLEKTEKPSRSQSTGSQRVRHYQSSSAWRGARHFFFCLWQLCASESWAWRWCSTWLAGTLAVPSVQGHGLPPLQELWPY